MRLNEFTIIEESVSDKAIWDEIAKQMTIRIDPSDPEDQEWIRDYLRYYISGNKIYIQDYDNTNLPEVIFSKKRYNQLGITKQFLITWLDAQGITKMKRPKPYKSSPPLYD